MAKTSIEWSEFVWNFLAGCSLKSPGCTNCYAMGQAARIERMSPSLAHYHGLTQSSKAGPVWTGKIGFAPHKLTEPLRVRKPAMWFVNSMSDLFHEDVPDEIIDRAFAVMALAPHHTFQVLTKRSARMREYLCTRGGDWMLRWPDANPPGSLPISRHEQRLRMGDSGVDVRRVTLPLPNVWLGVSTEDQQRADERIPDLLATPAAVRWISAEPLLGPLELHNMPWGTNGRIHALKGHSLVSYGGGEGDFDGDEPRLDWVVVGGESGSKARPMHPDWARSLRDQCAAAGVPFLFKQWGEWAPDDDGYQPRNAPLRFIRMTAAGHWSETGAGLSKIGKARAGRLLDGVEHNGFPVIGGSNG